MNKLKFIVCIAYLQLLIPIVGRAQYSLLHEEFSQPNFATPSNINHHVLNFFHHSCGLNLLEDGLMDSLEGLGYTLHSRIISTYDYENTYTDYRHWYKRFQRELGIPVGDHYYRYEGPDKNGEPVISTQIDDDYRDFMLNYYDFNAERMDIIMFKPCYPNSEINDFDTQFNASSDNNGFGQVVSGTPYSDNDYNNYLYLNSSSSVDDEYDADYWENGVWQKEASSLAQLKCAYRGMLNIFVNNPEILFIAMQAPPLAELSNEESASCREFARWLREDWLHQYDPLGIDQFEDYPLKNVVPFEFHNSVGWTGNNPLLDDEYFWFVQGGFADNTLDTNDSDKIGENASGRDHPASWLNQRTVSIFCGGTDIFSQQYTGQPPRTYYCWINAVVNRWEMQSTPVELTNFSARIWENSVILQWSTQSETNNYGFEVERATDRMSFKKIAFVPGNNTTTSPKDYQYEDNSLVFGKYFYRLKQIDCTGEYSYSAVLDVHLAIARGFKLYQNYPNPFNASTSIAYELQDAGDVELTIYNTKGQEVNRLLHGYQHAGYHSAKWDGTDFSGSYVPTGIYYCKLRANHDYQVIKLSYLK
ncbi:MAG: FlgD immunoglobulin-like domain containing protein [Candidatus Zhuqueibacterota bacterium]